MFVSNCAEVNERGHLTIGGCDTVKLAEEFGTPLYVMDENEIRENCRRFRRSIDEFYAGKGMVAYASKAFCCKEMVRLAMDEKMGLDVVSAGELFTALSVDFPVERIFYHGNNKTPEELTYAVSSGVGRIVVDNIFELELLDQIAKAAKTRVKIQFRIKPGVEAHTHEFVKTGGIDSKFGFAIETGEAIAAIREVKRMEYIDLAGLHCHIGSQIFDIEPFEHSAAVMLGLMAEAKKELGYEIAELNLGGGFGIKYLPGHNPAEYEKYMQAVSVKIKENCDKLGLSMPFVIIEPGRSVVGSAGITLYRVGAVKDIPGIRTYVTVDGGMTDNPRYALYHAEYDMQIANRATQPKNKTVTVAGRCCESDTLAEHILIQETKVGDILAVFATGAYNYSMAGNYNRLPKPAVVFIKDGEARTVVRRQSIEDVVGNDI